MNVKPKYCTAKYISENNSIGLSTVWKWSASGKLPKPHGKLGPKKTVWLTSDIESAFEDLIKGNHGGSNNG